MFRSRHDHQFQNEIMPVFLVSMFSFLILHLINPSAEGINGKAESINEGLWIWLSVAIVIIFLYLLRRYELNRIRLRNQLKLQKIESDSLRAMDQLKSRFFENISHEFRTPLTLILGQAESLVSSGLNEPETAKLHVLSKNARKLLTLVNQVLDLSKLESGEMKLNLSQQNIVLFLKDLFYSWEVLAVRKNISLTFNSDSENITMAFDPDKLEKVFYNLLSNALKFTDPAGSIKVEILFTQPPFVEILVENTGPGIHPDQLPHVFDRFYQFDHPNFLKTDGTGIGLALAKELAELHHGTLSVESKERVSTVFTVRLPLKKLNPACINNKIPFAHRELPAFYKAGYETRKERDVPGIRTGTIKDKRDIVLVVEDNTDVRKYIREQFEADYRVKEAENGKVGLSMAREIVPDLIIADLMMPVMDGFQFCGKIRGDERTSHIPLIMLTARAGFEDKLKGLETGIDDFMTKPFSTKELKVRVRNLINQRRLLTNRYSIANQIIPSEIPVISIDKLFLKKIITAIESNIENREFTVESLAAHVNMSTSQLNRKLNAIIGQPAGLLMRSIRLRRAADMLEKNSGSVSQICYQLGFTDQAYFSRAFKKQYGRTPGEFKKAEVTEY